MSFIEGFDKVASAASELKRMWNGTVHDKTKEKPSAKKTVVVGATVGGLLGANVGFARGMSKGTFARSGAKGVLIGAPLGAITWTALHKHWWHKSQAKKRKK